MSAVRQTRLIDLPLIGVYPVDIGKANEMLVAWGHKLGAVNRPFRQEAYALELNGLMISIAVSASAVNHAGGYRRNEIVELARLASCEPWANRVMLRLWRQICAPMWACWPVKAAISYSHNAMHTGNLYRFDGWRAIKTDCGSSGGGGWSRKRCSGDVVNGKKTLWVWDYREGMRS